MAKLLHIFYHKEGTFSLLCQQVHISDGFEKGNGKICEQQTFEFFASGDCCDCNRAEYSIAFCIDRKNRIRRKKNRALYRNRLGFFVSIIRLQRKRQRFLSQETSF